jgi:hypothetical protein
MGYDCSVTKRKGCNYCLKGKTIKLNEESLYEIQIDDNDCKKKATLEVEYLTQYFDSTPEKFEINYCPICGRELK